jgi:thiamine kinase-like enzyme
MLFVGQFSNIPVPLVHAIYFDEDTRVNYILMENVEGQTLASHWNTLITSTKTIIADKLRDVFNHLRNIPCPGEYFGSLGNCALEDAMFWTADDIVPGVINGPFKTEAQFNEAMALKYLYNNISPQKATYCSRVLPQVLRNHNPIFTNADFQRKNVIVRNDGTLVIIDWETAGWYPSYWEYTLAMFTCGRWDDDWHIWVAQTLDKYPNEIRMDGYATKATVILNPC